MARPPDHPMAEAQSTTLLVSTTNPGKIVEIEAELSGLPCRIIGVADLPLVLPEAAENGDTFAANALIKAEHYHALSSLLVLADDSGLEVDYLHGAPGIYSARYGGATSAAQIALLLESLKGVPISERTARFVCCLALVGNGLKSTFEGVCEGRIAFEPRGGNGFGYDPIFLDPELDLTFAELSREEKSRRSHRGKALRKVRTFLEGWLLR
jgi:non-canonical purine NTP pyrophosphatase (RdgB/HAM1 family)